MTDDTNYNPHLDRERLTPLSTPYATIWPWSGKNLTFNFVEAVGGAELEPHSHPHEQFSVIHSGRVRFSVEGQEPVVLGPREVLYVPPNLAHGAEILEDLVSFDVFSPVQEDLMRKVAEAQREAGQ